MVFTIELTPVLVQLSPRKFMVVEVQLGESIHQQWVGSNATGKFFQRRTGENRFTGTHAGCMNYIETHFDPQPTQGA